MSNVNFVHYSVHVHVCICTSSAFPAKSDKNMLIKHLILFLFHCVNNEQPQSVKHHKYMYTSFPTSCHTVVTVLTMYIIFTSIVEVPCFLLFFTQISNLRLK